MYWGLVVVLLVVGDVAMAAGAVVAYPVRPIRLICPLAPGGSVDLASRAIAQELTLALRQQVLVDNRSGGGGNIGAELAAKSPADGYTMVMGSSSTFGVNPSLYKNLPYDAVRDFVPVSFVSFAPNVLVVHPSVAAYSVKDLVTLAREKPGALSFASSGTGGSPHLAGELFKMLARVDIVHVPYKSTGASLNDLLGGHVQLSFGTALALLPQINSGKLRALAVTTDRRVKVLPDILTMAEAGLPGVETTAWNGILVPVGTPRAVVDRLNHEIVRILNKPDVRQQFASQGAEAAGTTSAEFADFIRREIAKWGKVVRTAGLTAN